MDRRDGDRPREAGVSWLVGAGSVRQDRRVDDRVLAAAESNARWCDLVCRSHGIPTVTERRHWVALRRSPDLYPDAVTILPGAVVEDVLRSAQDGPGCSVKDSFADLELGRLGFDELFRARWIFRDPVLSSTQRSAIWAVVETADDLAEWAQAADATDTFRSGLLRDPAVRILAARGPDGLKRRRHRQSDRVSGRVSNLFTTTMAVEEAWTSLADALAVHFPALPLVGYEHGEDLQAALASGFTEIGALRVWLRPSASGVLSPT
jgi:hypothetical protein